jgi:gluconokinase
MSKKIFPRSPREEMAGWVYLPRFIDKIRLHLAGQLPADYQENFTKGFDGSWLKAAGLTADKFIEVVKGTVTDGEVYDWVRTNVKKSPAEKAALKTFILNRGRNDEASDRLRQRKEEAGLQNRSEIQTFVDFIDADEGRELNQG